MSGGLLWQRGTGSTTQNWDGLTRRKTRPGQVRSLDSELERYYPDNIPEDQGEEIVVNKPTTYISDGHHPPNPSYKLFTDGSKQDTGWTGAGWALTIGDQIIAEGSTMLGRWATVYQAEMVAISEALRNILESDYLEKMKANGRGLEIYSDSQAAIKTLAKVITPGKIAIECAQ